MHSKPVAPAGSIFMSTVYVNDFDESLSTGKMLVADVGTGWFVTANATPTGKILMHRYGITVYSSSTVFYAEPTFALRDLVFDLWPNSADVLTYSWNATSTGSYIYHIPESAWDVNGMANVHYYEGENINSLDVCRRTENMFIASGHNDYFQSLRAYRYKLNNYSCAEKKVYETVKNICDFEDPNIDIKVINYPHTFHNIDSVPETIKIITICE